MAATARHYDTILAPVITEKATQLSELNKVVFRVALDATKDEIAAAVEALFKVNVVKVNTLIARASRSLVLYPDHRRLQASFVTLIGQRDQLERHLPSCS